MGRSSQYLVDPTRSKTRETYGIEDGLGLFATGGCYSLDEFDIFRFEQSSPLVALLTASRTGERREMMRSDDDGVSQGPGWGVAR
jgi:hypothetical protein